MGCGNGACSSLTSILPGSGPLGLEQVPNREIPMAVSHSIEYQPAKLGWRISEWGRSVGVSRATTYNLLNAGRISSVKLGCRATIITTSPRDFLESLRDDAQ